MVGNDRHEERQYLDILQRLVEKCEKATGDALQHGPQDVPAANLGCTLMEFDLSENKVPWLTTKKILTKNVIVELLWFLAGESRLDFLHQHNVHFWDMWATEEVASLHGLEEGDIGRIYGPNWIHWPTQDGEYLNQIKWLIDGLKTNPEWRRWKVIAWNPEVVIKDRAFLASCHGDLHCIMVDGKLELHHFQRSGDWFLGVPYNIASYATLLLMICQVTGLKPGKLVQVTSDSHLYINHLEPAEIQLRRKPRPFPTLRLDESVDDIFNFRWPDHFNLVGYEPHPFIPAEPSL